MPIPLNLPNLLTLCRIALIPLVLILIHQENFIPGFLLAGWVFLTDFLDGLLARKMGMVTQAGMIFDPPCSAIFLPSSGFPAGMLGWSLFVTWRS